MFKKIKQRFQDMKTIKALFLGAEKHANADGYVEPRAEHFVLAALDLPDGTARKAFKRVNIDPDAYHSAIAQQYENSLQKIGIEVLPNSAIASHAIPAPANKGIYKAQPSVQVLIQELANQKTDANKPLLGAHLILAVTAIQHGTAALALGVLGAKLSALAEAAKAEINAYGQQ